MKSFNLVRESFDFVIENFDVVMENFDSVMEKFDFVMEKFNFDKENLILCKKCFGHNWYDFRSILSLQIWDRHKVLLRIAWYGF